MWLTDLLNQLSYRFLNMPRDLSFTFTMDTVDNASVDADRRQKQLSSGQITINEARGELGLPLFDFPEADMPMLPNNLVPASDVQEVIAEAPPAPVADTDSGVEGESGTSDLTTPDKSMNPVNIELAAFAKWTKGSRKRLFMFEFLDAQKGAALNALAKNDPTAARELANALKADKADDSFTPSQGVKDARLNPEKGAQASDAGGRSSSPYLGGGRKAAGTNSPVRGSAAEFAWPR
jgi:hypothetical protein